MIHILMFGWEFPPHISGGLGTACHGLTRALINQGVKIDFVVPTASGDEPLPVVNASDIPLRRVREYAGEPLYAEVIEGEEDLFTTIGVESAISPYTSVRHTETAHTILNWNYPLSQPAVSWVRENGHVKYRFSGGYGPNLLEEVQRYAEVAAEIARERDFDVIHAHDWLTFPAGMAAKRVSGKPLVVHVHATELDRGGERYNRNVFDIEREGMMSADTIIAVSNWTKRLLVSRYDIPESKITVVHNGSAARQHFDFKPIPRVARNVVTFFGRVTYQKGPQYFVEAARKVLKKFPSTQFIVAGAGDLLPAMIEYVAQLRLSSKFHFTGFLRGEQIDQIWSVTNVYVMPSVSEPFGIAPLEAIQSGVPAIVSNQSGVAEVIPHALKVDFWDTDALADAIVSVLRSKRLSKKLTLLGKEEVKSITWEEAAKKVNFVYQNIIAS